MKNIMNYVKTLNANITLDCKTRIEFIKGEYIYIVNKNGNKYNLCKYKIEGDDFIRVSPMVTKDTQKEIVYFLKNLRNF